MNARYDVSISIVNLMDNEVILHPKLQPYMSRVGVDLMLLPKSRKTNTQWPPTSTWHRRRRINTYVALEKVITTTHSPKKVNCEVIQMGRTWYLLGITIFYLLLKIKILTYLDNWTSSGKLFSRCRELPNKRRDATYKACQHPHKH